MELGDYVRMMLITVIGDGWGILHNTENLMENDD
jgi:hypothetical protein